MPTQNTTERAKRDLAQGKRASTAAGEFVREEMEHIRQGRHGARSSKQAIAIGLSKARRAGGPLKPARRGGVPRRRRGGGPPNPRPRRSAARDYATGQGRRRPRAPSARRGRAVER